MAGRQFAVKIVGFSPCPFHAAAEKILQRITQLAPGAVSLEDVVTLPDADSFRAWAKDHGHASGTTSPICMVGTKDIGGYTELREWLANRVASHWEELDCLGSKSVALLSLQKHLKSRWLTDLRLAFALERVRTRTLCIDAEGPDGCVWSQEPEGGGLGTATTGHTPLQWSALINCVSDTAPPTVQQRLIAAMRAAEAAGVFVANGTKSHAACAGKVAQHALLKMLELPAPPTVVVSQSAGDALASAAASARLRFPLLLKPNAGGFGKGIASFTSVEDLRSQTANSESLRDAFAADGLALLQERILPVDGRVGRIWTLNGQVLCAVRAAAMEFGAAGPSGCMADSRAAASAIAWDPPQVIKEEVRRLAEAAGSAWGSVEMVSPTGDEEKERLYFDLNLSCISCLPDPALVSDPESIWARGFDPYTDLARWVLQKLPQDAGDSTRQSKESQDGKDMTRPTKMSRMT